MSGSFVEVTDNSPTASGSSNGPLGNTGISFGDYQRSPVNQSGGVSFDASMLAWLGAGVLLAFLLSKKRGGK